MGHQCLMTFSRTILNAGMEAPSGYNLQPWRFIVVRENNQRHSTKGEVMKIVVIGGTGLIGSKVVRKLTQLGHEALAAAPNTGVNTILAHPTMAEGLGFLLAGVPARDAA